jgi:hypothetical protein
MVRKLRRTRVDRQHYSLTKLRCLLIVEAPPDGANSSF